MVQVVPPDGWRPESKPEAESTPDQTARADEPAEAAAAAEPTEVPAENQPLESPPVESEAATAEPTPTPPPAQPIDKEPTSEATEQPEQAEQPEPETAAAAALVPGIGWMSPTEMLWRKWLMLAGGSIGAVVVIAGVVSFIASRRQPRPVPQEVVAAPAEPTTTGPTATDSKPEPAAELPDLRWLPDETRLVFSLHLSKLAEGRAAERLIGAAGQAWEESIGLLLRGLGLKRGGVGRVTWASTDLTSWPDRAVVVIRLPEGHDARALQSVGQPVDLQLDATPCRCLPNSGWPHPFAVIDQQTIVTGRAELLQLLADRSEPRLKSRPIDRLWKEISPGADIAVAIDLEAARRAGWRLPGSLMDIWPEGRQAWRLVWEVPRGLGACLRLEGGVQGKLGLVCEGKTAAEEVRASLEKLVPAAKNALESQAKALPDRLRAGRLTAAVAGQYEEVLAQGLLGLGSARSEVGEEIVWLRTGVDSNISALALAALDARPAIRTDWSDAAQRADEANLTRLLAGLEGYRRAEGYFPAGAVGGALLPPETRLSWIATMLPYYDHTDWHRRLQFGYTWNGRQNRPVTRQPLTEVINPTLGPSLTEAGFSVTHYVGVAGVGADAGRLKVDHPRAGVFGFGRRTRLEDIVDGASNTIAILGASGKLGAWGAGGQPTVRALTTPPYVNGPDGFGSGQSDGMAAGMADGSVRFISKNVDSRVLEQLATINGGENVTVAVLDRGVGPRKSTPLPRPKTKPIAQKPAKPLPAEDPNCSEQAGETAARLAERIPAIELNERPLDEVVRLLATLGNLPITFDLDAMSELGVGVNTPVNVRFSESTLGEILHAVLAKRGLDYVVEAGQVLITGPEAWRHQLRQVRYTVSDLADGQPAELATIVQSLVAPDSWRSVGGQGSIQPDRDALVVTQTSPIHHQVLIFCEKLRVARGKSPRSRLDPKQFELTTRLDQARASLARPVTVNFNTPTPLVEIVSHLAGVSETNILVNRLALAGARIDPRAACTLTVERQPLSAALDKLLGPLGLAYRAVNADTLEVTTRKTAADRLELEFYRVDKLLSGDPKAVALLERVKARVAASTWNDAGGPGVLYFDKPSGCLIVLQSQLVQAELQRTLLQWQAESKRQPKAPL